MYASIYVVKKWLYTPHRSWEISITAVFAPLIWVWTPDFEGEQVIKGSTSSVAPLVALPIVIQAKVMKIGKSLFLELLPIGKHD